VTRDDIYADLQRIFHDVFDNDTIQLSDAMTAKDIPQWDSLNHINIIVSAEKKFGIRFTTADIARLANVGQFVDTITRKIATRSER
jgi:acyl carrier protein